ncbi:MAG: mercuric reductase, partial [Planctomycetes bacterium]|nr:mercuric reductase [Planctomycetota bacterium]
MSDNFLAPLDAHDQRLLTAVQPPAWVNPEPKARYHLVVIGGGTAGLVSAVGAAALGAKVALIESRFLGGDCLNFGCVPSKALLRAARAAAEVRRAHEFGVELGGEVRVNFAAVMERMRRLRADLAPNDSAQRLRDLGVDVFLGAAQFTGTDSLSVGARALRFRRAVIATGTRPSVPAIAGLAEAGYLTNETIFTLTSLPGRLAIVGGGAVGCELAQAFARFGSRVTLLETNEQILHREMRDNAQIVRQALESDGVAIGTLTRVLRVDVKDNVRILTIDRRNEPARTVEVDAILVAAGRAPNIENLGLDAAQVTASAGAGVQVNDRLQTSNRRIFAAGDVCSLVRFTHAADAQARIVVQNALFHGRARASRLVIPRCLYTDPELAAVGMDERGAHEAGVAIDTFVQEFQHVDRAVIDGDAVGFVKVFVRQGTDKIVGATIVGRHAGEMINL